MLKHSDIEQLEKEFKKIDTDKTGFISVEELTNAFKMNDEIMTSDQIERIIQEVDFLGKH